MSDICNTSNSISFTNSLLSSDDEKNGSDRLKAMKELSRFMWQKIKNDKIFVESSNSTELTEVESDAFNGYE